MFSSVHERWCGKDTHSRSAADQHHGQLHFKYQGMLGEVAPRTALQPKIGKPPRARSHRMGLCGPIAGTIKLCVCVCLCMSEGSVRHSGYYGRA